MIEVTCLHVFIRNYVNFFQQILNIGSKEPVYPTTTTNLEFHTVSEIKQ